MRVTALRVFSSIVLCECLVLLTVACGGGNSPPCTGCPPPEVNTFLVAVAEPSLQSSQLFVFPIDATTGALGSPSSIVGPEPPISSALVAGQDQATPFLYVMQLHLGQGLSSQVYGYAMDPKTGVLTEIASSPYNAPDAITLSGGAGLNSFFYVGSIAQFSEGIAPAVEAFSIGEDGSLSSSIPGSPFAAAPFSNEIAGAGPWLAAALPYLYATETENDTSGGIAAFSIDTNTGVLTPLPGSPFSVPVSAPGKIIYDPLGYVYVTLSTPPPNMQSYIAGYAINASTGALTPVPGSPFSVGSIAGLALDGSGKFLFTGVDQTQTIDEFQVDSANGTLTPLAGAKAPVLGPFLVFGNNLYAPTASTVTTAPPGGPAIAAFTIDENTGGLTPVSGSPFSVAAPVLAMTAAETISH